jgi:hypothetical protein
LSGRHNSSQTFRVLRRNSVHQRRENWRKHPVEADGIAEIFLLAD